MTPRSAKMTCSGGLSRAARVRAPIFRVSGFKRVQSVKKMLVLAVLSGSAILYMARAQGQVAEKTPLSRWRSRDYAGIRYLGSDKCAECHSFQTGTQLATPMAHAMENPADSQILASHQELAFRN